MTGAKPTKREILDQLHISALRDLVRSIELQGVDKRSRRAMTEALGRTRRVTSRYLLAILAGGDKGAAGVSRLQMPPRARPQEHRAAKSPAQAKRATAGPVFVAIDFETANRDRDSACAVGLVRVEQQRIVAREHFLIRPPDSYFEFTYIHGITHSMVRDSPTFGELWPDLGGWLNEVDFLVAHNASFDRSVLRACCLEYGLAAPNTAFECTMKLARRQWGIYPTKLPDVCRCLDIELNHHQALSDAEAAARIVIHAFREGYRR